MEDSSDKTRPFGPLSAYYDVVYGFKDYARESRKLVELIRHKLESDGRRLLDVACGTGEHLKFLQDEFEVEGLDLSEEMLDIARAKLPGVGFHQGDMAVFDLGREYDAVVLLFSSIGYAKTVERLDATLACLARHTRPGGVVVVEPWFTPDDWRPDTVHAGLFGETPELRIARVNTSFREGRVSWFDLHHLVGTPEGTAHFVEHHELGLFTIDEMRAAFEQAGLETDYDPEGLTGRGLWVGVRRS
ncbi:MAG: class I SAM-dependent methyltransferase [candidate division WOR-3 bacterium]|nr:MAG: class I SAM-dependent methyltransferase [candidate division WOR-3 bacterium]